MSAIKQAVEALEGAVHWVPTGGPLNTVRAALAALREEQADRDGERYRWLRSVGHTQLNVMAHYAEGAMDAAIDAAMAQEKPHA
jgi:hypothetical protein